MGLQLTQGSVSFSHGEALIEPGQWSQQAIEPAAVLLRGGRGKPIVLKMTGEVIQSLLQLGLTRS